MIIDLTGGRLSEIRQFAAQNNLQDNLDLVIERLNRHVARGNTVNLYTDFAPLSMYFEIIRPDDTLSLNGGVIYHGSHDGFGSGAAPTFSVSMEPATGWEIHT